MSSTHLFRLFQLISPALPVGAFAYSQGMEMAVERGLITDENSCYEWLKGLIENNLAYVDLPLCQRLFLCLEQKNSAQFDQWNAWLMAARETKELSLESTLMAKALMRLLSQVEEYIRQPLPEGFELSEQPLDWVSAFTLACWQWQISLEQAFEGLAWSWLENQIAAAIKLIPLGQTQGQRLLLQLNEPLQVAIVTARQCHDAELGRMSPMQVMMSSLHETQYSRLFRS
ncbi:MAG: urease accessory protein UreF [Pseudomonadota bacterium]|nr:urease accessory protein UreF [Pseudomonadota bacterium]